jgi:hypothetical protein
MSQNDKTRTKLTIDAVVQAAATGAPDALKPLKKLATIAGLAGFVLRLFRSKQSLPPGLFGRQAAARIPEGSSNAVRRKVTPPASTPGLPAGTGPLPTTMRKGGLHHG